MSVLHGGVKLCMAWCVVLGLCAHLAMAEISREMKAALTDAMARVRNQEGLFVENGVLRGATPSEILMHLKPYFADSEFRVRRAAFEAAAGLLGEEGEGVPIDVQQQAVHEILAAVSDGSSGGWSDALHALKRFPPTSFDEAARNLVLGRLMKQRMPGHGTLSLVSMLRMKEALPYLRRRLEEMMAANDGTSGAWYLGEQWWVRKLMAELGDEESVKYCVKMIEDEEGLKVKSGLLLEMANVRHASIVGLLRKYLNDDAIYKDGIGFQRPISLNAISALARMLDGFPKPLSGYGKYPQYLAEDIPGCREWMAEQTEWKFKPF